MPHLRIRGMTSAQVQILSENLNTDLAKILNTSADNFTVEHVQSQFFNLGKPDAGYPFVDVHLFDRPAEAKAECARWLTDQIRKITKAADICVVFRVLDKASYFENGEHF